MTPEHGDRVFVAGRKGALRVVGFKLLDGERAMLLAASGDVEGPRERLRLKFGARVRATIPIANVVRDHRRRGWVERWQQTALL